MPALPAEKFRRLNLMAGTARSLDQETITPEDVEIWERDFALICDDLTKLVDAELGADLRAEKAFYEAALQVAKGYFDKIPFGGLKSATGQFGFRLITAQDLKTTAAGTSPAYYSWAQTLTSGTSGRSYQTAAIGYAGSHAYVRNSANKQAVMAFHRLISYKPSPMVVHVGFNINDYPYVPYTVEPYSKITKENKLFKIIPMPGRVILHPGGKIYITLYFDRQSGLVVPGTIDDLVIDIEIAPFGLIFGQYDYLASSELF